MPGRPSARVQYQFVHHEELADLVATGGARDALSIDQVLEVLPTLASGSRQRGAVAAARRIPWYNHDPITTRLEGLSPLQ